MWKKINKELQRYLRKYKNNQDFLLDNIETLLSDKINLDEKINANKVKRELLRVDFPQGSQLDYFKQGIMKKARITNREYILTMLYVYYWRLSAESDTLTTFNNISKISYETALKDLTESQKDKARPLSIYQMLIMTIPNQLGWLWQDYVMSEIIYNANQVLRQYQIDLQQERRESYRNILDSQLRQHLNISGKDGKKKYSGAVESMTGFIVNQITLMIAEDAGIKEVVFIGVSDERQTEMCKSLNGQAFKVNGTNQFKRYSKSNNGIVEYTVKGLILGINLPPITDNFHYCRSYIAFKK